MSKLKLGVDIKRALVTGASSGLGEGFSRQLASYGVDLVIVARRENRLKKLSLELEKEHGVDVHYLVCDLSTQEGVNSVVDFIKAVGNIDLLINNAGFGSSNPFALSDLSRQLDMMYVHMWAPVHLMKAALPFMLEKKKGIIINVSSLASWLPAANSGMYSATKSFLRVFTESLSLEVSQYGIYCQALCPGFTHTEFHGKDKFSGVDQKEIPSFLWMTKEKVIKKSLSSIKKGKVVVIPGWKNKLLHFFIVSPLFGSLVKKLTKTKTHKGST